MNTGIVYRAEGKSTTPPCLSAKTMSNPSAEGFDIGSIFLALLNAKLYVSPSSAILKTMPNSIKIIGAVGRNGSGKDEVMKYLKDKYNVPFLATGDVVREIAKKEGVTPTRENLGEISERYFQQLGKGCFVKMLAERLQQSGLKAAGISGIRSLDDVNILKAIFGHDFILIRVNVSDPQLRFARMTRRNEARDPHSYAQFIRQEENEAKIFNIKEAEKLADYTVSNDGTLADLHLQIDRLVAEGKLSLS